MNVDKDGIELLPGLLDPQAVKALLAALTALHLPPLRGGIRNIDRILPLAGSFANSTRLLAVSARHLPAAPQLVKATYFDKSPDNNWLVPWHQDKSIAVSERIEVPGWGPWSNKEGVWHVQPPIAILNETIAIRIHLDPAKRENGCLKVIPGTHRGSLLSTADIEARRMSNAAIYCEAGIGDALAMRPHLLHASEKISVDAPRRVLHFEYSSATLPHGLAWRS